MSLFVGDSGIGSAAFVVGLETVGASVHVVGYFKFFLDMVFELLYATGLFVPLGEVVDVSLVESGDEAAYHGTEHVCHEPCKAVSHNLGGLWGEGSGRRFSHNGRELLSSNGESWGGGGGRFLVGRFDGHGRAGGRS